jgi:hypothetical protein
MYSGSGSEYSDCDLFFTFVGNFTNKTGNVHINVTFGRVRVTIITVEMQLLLLILNMCL